MSKPFSISAVAAICHEANRALCEQQGDKSQIEWKLASAYVHRSAVDGVAWCLKNPDQPAKLLHQAWFDAKTKEGWVYGENKNYEEKTHPCLLPWDDLPASQQAKDRLFKAIVGALSDLTELDGFDFDGVRDASQLHTVGATP